MDKARGELAAAEEELHEVQEEVSELDRQLQAAFHAKAELEEPSSNIFVSFFLVFGLVWLVCFWFVFGLVGLVWLV